LGESIPTAEFGLAGVFSQQASTTVALHSRNTPLSKFITTRELGPLTDAPSSPVDIATHLSEAMSKIPSDLALPIFCSHRLQTIGVFVDSLINLVSLNIRNWFQQQMATAAELFDACWPQPKMKYTPEQQQKRRAARQQMEALLTGGKAQR
jgi:hypothetical protein